MDVMRKIKELEHFIQNQNVRFKLSPRGSKQRKQKQVAVVVMRERSISLLLAK